MYAFRFATSKFLIFPTICGRIFMLPLHIIKDGTSAVIICTTGVRHSNSQSRYIAMLEHLDTNLIENKNKNNADRNSRVNGENYS
jgi:hypothetical protein